MSYKQEYKKEFNQVGFWNPNIKKLVSTKKGTEGFEYDIEDALNKIGADGVEISVKITYKEVSEDLNTPNEE